jgi:hypothetical protein
VNIRRTQDWRVEVTIVGAIQVANPNRSRDDVQQISCKKSNLRSKRVFVATARGRV